MAAQPTDEDIDMVCSLTTITRSEAISRLKVCLNAGSLFSGMLTFLQGNNNNVSQAVNEYYENPGRNPVSLDQITKRLFQLELIYYSSSTPGMKRISTATEMDQIIKLEVVSAELPRPVLQRAGARNEISDFQCLAFQIQGADDHGTGGFLSGAPSRPPSRTNTRSPLGRSMSQVDCQQDGTLPL